MGKPSDRSIRDKAKARSLSWDDLQSLWARIKAGEIDDWDEGKALEHLVIRAFELSRLRVEYPYNVPPGGKPLEQIDGLVFLREIPFLVECKDTETIDVEPIAKLHHKLLRRPPITLGCFLTRGNYTVPAVTQVAMMVPHRMILWSRVDIDSALVRCDFRSALREKYLNLCMYGLTDNSPYFKKNEAEND